MFKRIISAILLGFVAMTLASCEQKPVVSKDIESPFFGNKSSKVQLTIYSDFQCPMCIVFHEKIGKKLESDYIKTGKVGYTFQNFPLPFHQNAKGDAAAAMCAQAQGKFLEFGDKMYALEKEKDGLNVEDADRIKIAKDIGADEAAFTKCLQDGNYINKVAQDEQAAIKKEIKGTPTVLLNGKQMDYDSEAAFFAIIDAALK